MATGLENYPNTSAADASYPSKNIKDNPGDGTGTPFSKLVYADIHQFFAKMMRMVGLVPNANPENEVNGFQYIEALMGVAGQGFGEIVRFNRTSSITDQSAKKTPLIVVTGGGLDLGDISLLDSADPEQRDFSIITIVNKSANTLNVYPSSFDSDTIDGASSLAMAVGSTKRLMLDITNEDWIVLD